MRLLLLALGSAALLLQCRPDEVRPLRPGQAVQRMLGPGQIHSYTFSASGEDFILLRLKQRGMDLTLELLNPEGQSVGVESLKLGGDGFQVLPAVAGRAGSYRVVIRSNTYPEKKGKYALWLAPLQRASTRDRDRAQAELIRQKAERLTNASESGEATRLFQQSITLALKAGDLRQAALARLALGVSQRGQKPPRLSEARQTLLTARGDFRRQGMPTLEEEALFALGGVAFNLEEIDESLNFYREAYELSLHIKGTLGHLRQAKVLGGMGVVYRAVGDYDSALKLNREALELWPDEQEPAGRVTILSNLGELHLGLNDPESALNWFAEALEVRTENPCTKLRTLSGIGLAYQWSHRPDQALSYLRSALRLGVSCKDTVVLARIFIRIGTVYIEAEDSGLHEMNLFVAQVAFSRALSLARQAGAGARREESNAQAVLAHIYDVNGHPGEARQLFEKARIESRKRRDPEGELGALYGLAEAEWSLGDPDRARATLGESFNRLEDLRRAADTDSMRRTLFSLRRRHFDLAVRFLLESQEGAPSATSIEEAFEVSEKGRARTLLDVLMRDSPLGHEQVLSEKEKELKKDLRQKRRERNRLESSDSPEDQHQIQEIEQEMQSIVLELEQIQVESRPLSLASSGPLSVKEIRGQVLGDDDRALLLSYWLSESVSFLWVIDRNDVTVYRLPGRGVLEREAREAYHSITEHAEPQQETLTLLARLSAQLLGPIADQLQGRHLLIVPDGELHSIPWAALPYPRNLAVMKDRQGDEIWHVPTLGDNNNLVVLPSASVLAALQKKLQARPSAPYDIAVIANPKYQPDSSSEERGEERLAPLQGEIRTFKELPHTQAEAEAILSLYPTGRKFSAFREEANRGLIESGSLSKFNIVHFALHGVSDPIPELSGLVFSQFDKLGRESNGLVHAFEIARMSFPAELVVLSACETGIGKNVPGEGVLNLTRAFFSAGAKRVVVSLWSVDDEATSFLMKYFYQGIQRGLTYSEALQYAQGQVRKSAEHPEWAHPYYWAGFILQGEW